MSTFNDRDDADRASREIIRPPVDDSVANELEFHIEMRTRELIERGVPADEARRQATQRFGDIDEVSTVLKRLARQTDGVMRRTRYFSEVVYDARFAFRMLVRRRTYAAIAIGTLALGIGAATAIYSVVDGVLLRPLPFDEPDRLAAVWITQPSAANNPTIAWLAEASPMGNLEYQALKDAKGLRDLAMWSSGAVTLSTDRGLERLSSITATSTLLTALRVRPAVGRAFAPGEDALNGPNVAMVSWEAWRTRFGADTSVVGRSVTLNEKPYTLIGVLPPGLRVERTDEPPTFWVPALHDSSDLIERKNRNYHALARLAPGVTLAAASREVATILRATTGDTTVSARVEQWQRDQGRSVRGSLYVLFCAVGLLLLIACANVAILQLGEASARAREMAARAALGAGVGRLVRQLLVESLVVALVSALLGTALAWAMIRGLIAIAPERLPGMDTVALNGRVLAFTMACAALTGLLFGIVPALIAGRAGATALVRSGVGQTGRGTRRTQQTLIAVQLALSMVLLVEAALFARSLGKLSVVDPGFRASGLTAVTISLPRRYSDEQTFALTNAVVQRISAQPGVERITAATRVPFVGGTSSSPIIVDRLNAATEPQPRNTLQRYVLPDYFSTMGIRLIAGRAFNADDRAGGELVAVVSAAEVMRDFPGESPLGRLVKHQGKWRRIVGVVADVKYRGLGRDDEATLYVPYAQYMDGWPMFMIRGPAGAAIGPTFKAMLREVEPRATLTDVVSLPEAIGKSYAAERYRTVLVSAFGVMAALLAAVGLYGVSVRSAARRTREIGIRLALGGTSATVVRLLVSDAMRGVVIGLTVGVPAALLVGRVVAPYLFKVSPNDPISFAVVSVILVTATAIASVIPARTAGNASPAVVLRAE